MGLSRNSEAILAAMPTNIGNAVKAGSFAAACRHDFKTD
jgi:hypothetical protein